MTIPQISVFLENKAGQLADITGILSENQVNMRAINIAETADYGVLRSGIYSDDDVGCGRGSSGYTRRT